jgi:hypothetical protein
LKHNRLQKEKRRRFRKFLVFVLEKIQKTHFVLCVMINLNSFTMKKGKSGTFVQQYE